jgi:hypothetical protein
MATDCYSLVRATSVRVTQLDECGELGDEFAVSEGWIEARITAEYEAGDEFIQKNANGDLCINERAPDALKRLNVEVDWCVVDPDIISLITGADLELDGADAVGFRRTTGINQNNFALELWAKQTGGACGPTGQCYGYYLVPFITGATLGDVTFGNAAFTFTTTGYTVAGAGWGVGPYDVIGDPAGPLDVEIGADQIELLRTTCVAPPAAVCGVQALSPTSP